MTSPERVRTVAELDALTAGLSERAEALARRLDRVVQSWQGSTVNGRRWVEGVDLCPRCLTHACPGCTPVQPDPVVAVVNGGVVELVDGEALCVWCRLPAGDCTLTGGQARCDGTNEWHADQLAVAAAPRITTPIRTGGTR